MRSEVFLGLNSFILGLPRAQTEPDVSFKNVEIVFENFKASELLQRPTKCRKAFLRRIFTS